MNTKRILGFWIVGCVAWGVYACSSSSNPPDGVPGEGGSDGGNERERSSNPDSGMRDTGTDMRDSGQDGSDIITNPLCIGNPLAPDGGAEGGIMLEAGVATPVFVLAGSPFLDGPQWIEEFGGQLVVSNVYLAEPSILRINVDVDGGSMVPIRTMGNGQYVIGNAVRDGIILTTLAPNNGAGTPAILQTLPDGGVGEALPVGGAHSPNDLVVGTVPDSGLANIYFTDPEYQAQGSGDTGIYRIDSTGSAARFTPDGAFDRFNGIALSPNGRTLYASTTDPKAVYAFAVGPDGAVTNGNPPPAPFLAEADLVDNPDGLVDNPDGIAVDQGGNIWVAEADGPVGPTGRVEVFSSLGQKLATILFPDLRPTGVAFGGADATSVFVTTQDKSMNPRAAVYRITTRCPGLK